MPLSKCKPILKVKNALELLGQSFTLKRNVSIEIGRPNGPDISENT
jgi:hypothetical protein